MTLEEWCNNAFKDLDVPECRMKANIEHCGLCPIEGVRRRTGKLGPSCVAIGRNILENLDKYCLIDNVIYEIEED